MKRCDLLLIEDDPAIRSLIRQAVDELHLKLHEETDGVSGEARAREYLPSVVLLDLGLPNRSGLDVLKGLKKWFKGSVIVITAWQDEEAKLQAFELGTDDYITKPFSPRELLARIRVALRRAAADRKEPEQKVRIGRLLVDPRPGTVQVEGGGSLGLTVTEAKFVIILSRQAGSLVRQTTLLEEIWGPNHADDTHYLRILVSRLRKKLASHESGVRIVTESGLGYRMTVAEG
jgi:two-component system KDP operon response regulator KdpE